MKALNFLTRTRSGRTLDWTDWLSYVYLTMGLFLMFGPVLWLAMSSFKTESALNEFPPSFLPYGQKAVAVPGEEKMKPVYRVKMPDGTTKELAELRRIGLTATHVDPARPDDLVRVNVKDREPVREFKLATENYTTSAARSVSAPTCGTRCSSPSSPPSSRCCSIQWPRLRCRNTNSKAARRCFC